MALNGPGLWSVIAAITISEIPRVVRLVRAVVLSLREEPYVEAAITLSSSRGKILWQHLMPNTRAPLIVRGTYICASAILVEAILSFLGAGVSTEIPTWGNIMAEGRLYFQIKPMLIFWPGLMLSVCIVSINLLGDAARYLLDPRLKTRGGWSMEFRSRDFGNADPVLAIENLTVRLEGKTNASLILDGVSLSIRAGETACLVGESGSGKSVTALAVMGLLPGGALGVAGGRIDLCGENLLDLSPKVMRRRWVDQLSMVFQEPMTALDVTTQKQILSLIAGLQERRGTAVLFITHDMGVVAEITDTVHVMKGGRIIECATTENILRAPREDYTRDLLRAVPSLSPRAPRAEADGESVLKIEDLGKRYGSRSWFARQAPVEAAQGVGFSVPRGRTLGIVGESGSGKSTVVRCILRLVDPSSGSIRVGGTDIAPLSRSALKPYRPRIQTVFQDPFRSLNPRWIIGQSLIEGSLNCGCARASGWRVRGNS